MSALASGCLELARGAANAELDVRFGTRVKEIRPNKVSGSVVSWQIFDKDGRSHGEFDWVVVSGATPALARWRAGFKEEPPVLEAARASGSSEMRSFIAALDKPLAYESTHVALLAWDVSSGDAGQLLRDRLPFDITHVSDDPALAKIVLQSLGPPYAVVALHSTGDFARRHKAVMGSGSYVSVTNDVEGSVADEAAVARELLASFQRLLATQGAAALPPPAWGPALHRWGAAFPAPALPGALASEEAWVLPADRFVFAGDFLAPPSACVAAALRSGLAAGEALLRHADRRAPPSSM